MRTGGEKINVGWQNGSPAGGYRSADQSRMLTDANQNRGVEAFEGLRSVKPYWIVSGRAALRDINFGGLKAELALLGKNIFDEDEITSALVNANLPGSANDIQGRSYGVDLNIEF